MLHRDRTEKSRLTVFHLVQPVEGGVARVVTDLVRAQIRAGVRPVVACPPGGPLAAEAAAAGATVRPWTAERSPGPSLAREVLTASRLIQDARPHVVHAHSAKAGLAGRLAVRGRVPTVFQPHAWSFDAVQGREARLALGWERYGTRWSTRTLCVSDSERRAGEAAGIRARWTVIRNGIDLARFPDDAEGRRRTEARTVLAAGTGAPPPGGTGAPLVVCVGRLCRQKGQDVLLAAWPAVARAVPGARLALVGDGPDAASLGAAAPPGVLLAGPRDDVRPWLYAADAVVLPSRWEGMALAPLEAMACGRPVVLTDVSGARESLPPGEEDHLVVPPEDPAALAAALVRLLLDDRLRTRAARRAAAHVRASFDVRRTAGAVLGLYQELLSTHRPLTRKRTQR
ncbi:glycosyltransferase family 4 protein [Streptomyces zhihengii]|uniref:Glycosyltransferase family 4 protein n=1 Tax=Streptomyces zhihengii TaxID=1818004 RepID=A0ABS2URE4_9ACTN|nr:glycosyltransferase family 4 protein [Streptomyces zhihengii]MBM9619653.1 glycosyltransferase family 4 protein [Streptomyces zhihengii]